MIEYNGIKFEEVDELIDYQKKTKPKSHHAKKRKRHNKNHQTYTEKDIRIIRKLVKDNKMPNGRLKHGTVRKIQKLIGHTPNSIGQVIYNLKHSKGD